MLQNSTQTVTGSQVKLKLFFFLINHLFYSMVLTVKYSSTELYCSPELQNYILLIRPLEQRFCRS